MDNDATAPVLPTLDEQDVAAIVAILIRAFRAKEEIAEAREVMKKANERIAAANRIVSSAYGSLELFGFTTDDENVNLWDLVREAIGEDYNRGIAIAQGSQMPPLLKKMSDGQPLTGAVQESLGIGDKLEVTIVRRPVHIRAAILEYLRTLGADGAKVAQVKQHLADAYDLTVHEKTPGMTLYRLLKDGLVRREGRTWFAIPSIENKENEAPTAETESASDTAQ